MINIYLTLSLGVFNKKSKSFNIIENYKLKLDEPVGEILNSYLFDSIINYASLCLQSNMSDLNYPIMYFKRIKLKNNGNRWIVHTVKFI